MRSDFLDHQGGFGGGGAECAGHSDELHHFWTSPQRAGRAFPIRRVPGETPRANIRVRSSSYYTHVLLSTNAMLGPAAPKGWSWPRRWLGRQGAPDCAGGRAHGPELGYTNAGTSNSFGFDSNMVLPRDEPAHSGRPTARGDYRHRSVRSQILVAQGCSLFGPELDLPPQDKIPRIGYAVQCRITTEDPENKFTPDYGKILNYRSAAGFGIRLDGGMGDTGSVITPFYDSLLVKVQPRKTFDMRWAACRALREFRIRGVKTNIPFVETSSPTKHFGGQATTTLIDTSPGLLPFNRRDRATMLSFSGDVSHGNPPAKGSSLKGRWLHSRRDATAKRCLRGTAVVAGAGGEKFAQCTSNKSGCSHATTSRRSSIVAGHARAQPRQVATADAVARRNRQLFSRKCGAGDLRDACFSAGGSLGSRQLAPDSEHCLQFSSALNASATPIPHKRRAGFIKHAAGQGIDFYESSIRSQPRTEGPGRVQETNAVCEAAFCYTCDVLTQAHSIRSV